MNTVGALEALRLLQTLKDVSVVDMRSYLVAQHIYCLLTGESKEDLENLDERINLGKRIAEQSSLKIISTNPTLLDSMHIPDI